MCITHRRQRKTKKKKENKKRMTFTPTLFSPFPLLCIYSLGGEWNAVIVVYILLFLFPFLPSHPHFFLLLFSLQTVIDVFLCHCSLAVSQIVSRFDCIILISSPPLSGP
jgi:hypothetical protein